MKKLYIKSMVFILVMLISLTVYPTLSLAAGQVSVSLGQAVGSPGQTLQVKLSLANLSAIRGGILTADFRVTYDKTKLQLVTIKKGSAVPAGAEFYSNPGTSVDMSANPGSIAFLFSGVAQNNLPITSDGVFAVMDFKIKENVASGNYIINFNKNKYSAADVNFKELKNLALINGNIKVGGAAPSSGKLPFDNTVPGNKTTGSLSNSNSAKSSSEIILKIGSKQMVVNNTAKTIDAGPIIINKRTMVPIRVVAESLGVLITWNKAAQKVTINLGNKTLTMVIGKAVSGMDATPRIVNDRIMVPIRYISENFGANVQWQPASGRVKIVK